MSLPASLAERLLFLSRVVNKESAHLADTTRLLTAHTST